MERKIACLVYTLPLKLGEVLSSKTLVKFILHHTASHPQNIVLFGLLSVYFLVISKLNAGYMHVMDPGFEEVGISVLYFSILYLCLFGQHLGFKLKIGIRPRHSSGG
jgi:hypothetical protein